MRVFFLVVICLLSVATLRADKDIFLDPHDCLFVKYSVPEKGIVCSNYKRALRLTKRLDDVQMHVCAWGTFVAIGNYKGNPIFIGAASVGSGSGLLFTELFVQGAKYIIRYGSDDVKNPPTNDAYLVKIVDEADNLYGYNRQSGVDPKEWGAAVMASPDIINALISTAKTKKINYEMRICHHLENYHGLRSPEKFSKERRKRLDAILEKLGTSSKASSFDMETAVLFRVAKDFGLHAATILQTVNKEDKYLSSYEGENLQRAKNIEESIFFNYVLDALVHI